ncbi:MAG TPA: hypothetical protein H9839_05155 [Candidatus Intestinimonas stercorigallinarum]|nr:hypothetical protein [Candidatus Intestinimonas stercorigallinarum]
MEQEFYLPVLSHFENDNGWSGSRGLLCYEIEKPREGTMHVVIWQGPFCRSYARQEGEADFPVSEEGVAALRAWLLERADAMNAQPPRTAEECRAYYEAQSGQSAESEG